MITFDSHLNAFIPSKTNTRDFFSVFGTTALGDGKTIENIYRFLQTNALPYRKIVSLEQIHSVNIHYFESQTAQKWEKIADADGAITKDPHVALVVLTADCLPAVFTDSKTGMIGISHQGWRGSLKQMVVHMVRALEDRGARTKNILVSLGPSIGGCCYTIDDERYYAFLEEFDGYSDKIFSIRRGQRYLNLLLLNILLLQEIGIPKDHIDYFPFCTVCDKKRFFSFRRHPVSHSNFPRTFNIIMKLQ